MELRMVSNRHVREVIALMQSEPTKAIAAANGVSKKTNGLNGAPTLNIEKMMTGWMQSAMKMEEIGVIVRVETLGCLVPCNLRMLLRNAEGILQSLSGSRFEA
jgi:hypothetical protein